MGAGLHPNAAPGEAGIHQTPRYALIEDSLRGVLRTPICGQHIHVGMPDQGTAVRAYNGIRTHIPLINALASNSPFWFGEDSGLASSRTVIFRSYPRAAMAPEFDDFDHFCRVTRQVCAAGDLEDYTTSGGTRASIPGSERLRFAPPIRNSTCGARAPSRSRPLSDSDRGRARPDGYPGTRGTRRVELSGDPPRTRPSSSTAAAPPCRLASLVASAWRPRVVPRRSSAVSESWNTSRPCSRRAPAPICSARFYGAAGMEGLVDFLVTRPPVSTERRDRARRRRHPPNAGAPQVVLGLADVVGDRRGQRFVEALADPFGHRALLEEYGLGRFGRLAVAGPLGHGGGLIARRLDVLESECESGELAGSVGLGGKETAGAEAAGIKGGVRSREGEAPRASRRSSSRRLCPRVSAR